MSRPTFFINQDGVPVKPVLLYSTCTTLVQDQERLSVPSQGKGTDRKSVV